MDAGYARSQDVVAKFATYEEYLDSQTTNEDLEYLQDEALARRLVELGYRGSGETLKREEFEMRKRELEASRFRPLQKPQQAICGAGGDYTGKPFLQALAEREPFVRAGKLTTIVFIRDFNAKGQEISGYIDLADRLQTEDFRPIFQGKKRLLPRPTDLSYYNWASNTATSSSSPNFQVLADDEQGILFKNRRDRKVISVDPGADTGDNSERVVLQTDEYAQVVLYDHVTRRKS